MRRNRFKGIGIAGIVVAVILMAGCSAGPSAIGPDDSTKDNLLEMRWATLPAIANLPGYVALRRGIFESHGLHVDMTESSDFAANMVALGRQFDVTGGGPALYNGPTQRGVDLTVLSPIVVTGTGDYNDIVLLSKEPVSDFSDLRNAKIGVAGLTGSSVSSLRFLLEDAGLTAEDYDLVQLPYASHVDNLDAGNIDAAVSTFPFAAVAEEAGYVVNDYQLTVRAAREITGDKVTTAASNLWIAETAWAEKNPEKIEAWNAAIDESVGWILDNKDAAYAYLSEWLGTDPKVTASIPMPTWETEKVDPSWFAVDWATNKAVGLADGDFNPARVHIWGK